MGDGRAAILALSLLLVFLATGCAAPSEPTARRASIPAPVGDLAATQQGHQVILTFTLPTRTADGRPLPATPSIDVYRQYLGPDQSPAPGNGTGSLAVQVPAAMLDHFSTGYQVRIPVEIRPEDLAQHQGQQTVFIVRTRVSSKKVSEDSNVASVRFFPALEALSDVRAALEENAIVLTWQATPAPSTNPAGPSVRYRIYRSEIAAALAASGATPDSAHLVFKRVGEVDTPPFRDLQIQFGHTYVYSVRVTAIYDAAPGVPVESSDSNLVAVTPKDVFAPAAPRGLIGVVVPASGETPAYLDLSWDIGAEPDLSGYNIYRSEQVETPALKLNDGPLLTPVYRDITVVPGHLYTYKVTALDRAGNESPASAPVSVGVPAADENDQP